MLLKKRDFLASAAAVLAFGGAVAAGPGRAEAAELRIGRAALRTLPADTLRSLAGEGRAQRGESRAAARARAAADYRAGRTVALERVLLSRAEVSRAIDAAVRF
jgi:hypothetical protein